MKLSILIPTLEHRADNLKELVDCLRGQMSGHVHYEYYPFGYRLHDGEVEIITDNRNKTVSTGNKRNSLLKAATADYVVFIDDDDEVPEYYILEMLIGCHSGADCMAINGWMTTDGNHYIKWYLSKDNANADAVEDGKKIYLRKTNHITAVKRELALLAGFPDKSNAEDKHYSDRVAPLCKTEFTIAKPMYHYRYSTQNKEYK